MIKLNFTVEGIPYPWQRPRKRGRGKGYYNTEEMESWKTLVGTYALQALSKHRGKAREKLDYYRETEGIDVHLILIFDFKNKWPYTRYDIDNLEKNVLDALEGILYVNDKQVCHVVKDKNYYDGEIMMGLKVEITYWERAKNEYVKPHFPPFLPKRSIVSKSELNE